MPSGAGTLQFAPRRSDRAMDRPLDDGTAAPAQSEERLDSWKEIATYLNRDVTTVQRWEKREGMPVHRHQHDRMGSVYAFRAELDAWTHARNVRAPADGPAETPPHVPPARGLSRIAVCLAGLVTVVVSILWLRAPE